MDKLPLWVNIESEKFRDFSVAITNERFEQIVHDIPKDMPKYVPLGKRANLTGGLFGNLVALYPVGKNPKANYPEAM